MKKNIWNISFGIFALLICVFGALIIYHFISPGTYAKEGVYYSRSGRFEVPVPVQDSWGGKINDGKGFVSFTDDQCRLFRIDYGGFPEAERRLLERMGRHKYLSSFLDNVYLKTFLRKRIPETSVDFEEYMSERDNGLLYAQIDAPKSSVCAVSVNKNPAVRKDAKRGILIVLYRSRIYVITTSFMLLNHKTLVDLSEWDMELKKDLQENTISFAQTITFRN
jgi:hypothetical protein